MTWTVLCSDVGLLASAEINDILKLLAVNFYYAGLPIFSTTDIDFECLFSC